MDKKSFGAWLIHHTNKLQKVQSQHDYENIFVAGKAGILLSAIAKDQGDDTISNRRLEALAVAAKINKAFELPELIRILREKDLIDVSENGIAVLGVSTTSILSHTSDIFASRNPSAIEQASVHLAEHASETPISGSEARDILQDEYKLSSSELLQTLGSAEAIGFVDSENLPEGDKLLFNGNLFRHENPIKIKRVLDSLSAGDKRSIEEATETLHRRACIEAQEIKNILGQSLYDKVTSIGLFDINVVSNDREETAFVTLPSAFRKFSSSTVEDAFDLAKAFVSSITYGMTKSTYSRGRIEMVHRLLQTLVAGEPVGPATAIEHDYKVLEFKGVVKVEHGHRKGRSGPLMRLRKREVGELALQLISAGDISEHSLDSLPSAAVTKYMGPEENREAMRRKVRGLDSSTTTNMLRVLRSGGF